MVKFNVVQVTLQFTQDRNPNKGHAKKLRRNIDVKCDELYLEFYFYIVSSTVHRVRKTHNY